MMTPEKYFLFGQIERGDDNCKRLIIHIYIIYTFVHSSTFCTIYLTSSLKCSLKVYWYPVLSHMTKHVLSFFFTRNLLGGGGC